MAIFTNIASDERVEKRSRPVADLCFSGSVLLTRIGCENLLSFKNEKAADGRARLPRPRQRGRIPLDRLCRDALVPSAKNRGEENA